MYIYIYNRLCFIIYQGNRKSSTVNRIEIITDSIEKSLRKKEDIELKERKMDKTTLVPVTA